MPTLTLCCFWGVIAGGQRAPPRERGGAEKPGREAGARGLSYFLSLATPLTPPVFQVDLKQLPRWPSSALCQ